MYTTVQIFNKAVQQYEQTSLHNSVNKQQLCTTVQKTTRLYNITNRQQVFTPVQINNKWIQWIAYIVWLSFACGNCDIYFFPVTV